MNLKKIFFVLNCLLIISCSSDDSNGNGTFDANTIFPMSNGNYWTYNVNTNSIPSRDSLYISGDTIIATKTYKKFKTLNVPTGFFSSSLRNNGVRVLGSKLLLSGGLNASPVPNLPLDLNVSISDFVIFDGNASSGTTLSTVSNSFQQTIQDFPLTISYTLTSKAGESSNNQYSTKISLNLTISTQLSGFTIPILSNQEVLTSLVYFEPNKGVTNVQTNTQYQLNDISNFVTLPFPSTGNQTQTEQLDTYSIN